MSADTLTAVTPEDASWYTANKDTVTENFMDALAHLERDEGTINFVDKDAGVKLGIISPDKVSVPTSLRVAHLTHPPLIVTAADKLRFLTGRKW